MGYELSQICRVPSNILVSEGTQLLLYEQKEVLLMSFQSIHLAFYISTSS